MSCHCCIRVARLNDSGVAFKLLSDKLYKKAILTNCCFVEVLVFVGVSFFFGISFYGNLFRVFLVGDFGKSLFWVFN